jgi:hypothetical protein
MWMLHEPTPDQILLLPRNRLFGWLQGAKKVGE